MSTWTDLREEVNRVLPECLALYMRLHQHPELSGAEVVTAQHMATALHGSGYAVVSDVGGHGVVGVLCNGPGPTVLMRTEMDALPLHEATGLAYASTVMTRDSSGTATPVMHACGHDAHMAALLGAADVLAHRREQWSGTLMVVCQPSEETLVGAEAMIADDLYGRFGIPDVALAQHLAPLPAGVVGHGRVMLAGSRTLRITVHGRGGHASDRSGIASPIETAARLVVGLQAVVPADVTATAGTLHAGRAVNVVPDEAILEVSVRAATTPAVERAAHAIAAYARREGRRSGGQRLPEVTETARSVPTVNSLYHAGLVRQAHVETLSARQVVSLGTSHATEDFPAFASNGRVPLVYWMLGCIDSATWSKARAAQSHNEPTAFPTNHSPCFAPAPVPTLRTGITAMATGALAFLRPHNAPIGTRRSV